MWDSKMLIQASSDTMAQEGSAAQVEEFSDVGDGDDDRMADFEDVRAPGGAPRPGQATASTKYSILLNAATPPSKKPRTTEWCLDESESMRRTTISCSRVPCRTPGASSSQS